MNSFEKMILAVTVFFIGAFSYPVFSEVNDYNYFAFMNWMQTISGTIYVGFIFFTLFVLPKGSLQSASVNNSYQRVFNGAFFLLFFSTLFNQPFWALMRSDFSWTNFAALSGQAWFVQVLILFLLCILPFGEKI